MPQYINSSVQLYGSDKIMILTLYFHSRQYVERGWLYRDIIFSLPTMFGEGVIISWNYIITPNNIWEGADYHYIDVIMSAMASKITSLTIAYSIVYSGAHQGKYQSSASLTFVRGIHRSPMNSPYKVPVMRKMFPFDDITMYHDIIPSLLTIFGEGVIISWHYIF